METNSDSDKLEARKGRNILFHTTANVCLGVFCGQMFVEASRTFSKSAAVNSKLYKLMSEILGGAVGGGLGFRDAVKRNRELTASDQKSIPLR